MSGISFDRAADYYDATRGLAPELREALADVLATALRGKEPCLEIGVGTGRIALPLAERGLAMIGADIAPAMLQRLVANAGGRRPFPLLLADATRLPLLPSSLGAVMASHVLHLIPNWRSAVDESLRVLHCDGVLLVDFGGGTPAPWGEPSERIMRGHGVVHDRPGVSEPSEVADYLAGRMTLRSLRPVTTIVRRTLRQDLNEWEHQIHAWTWPYSAEQMRGACASVRAWAVDAPWPLDEVAELERTIQWWSFSREG